MIIFTSICANYLHKARTLADSVKKHIPEALFIVCLVEKEIKEEFRYHSFDEIVLAKDAWEGNFEKFIYKHAIVEASTAVKGQFFRYLYQTHPEEQQFCYLDPDTYVYDNFVELKELLLTHPIILCPHLLQPGNIAMELSSTAHGVYNLGFLAVNNSDEARRFIDWWAERLSMFCYDDIPNGIFTDQKWIDLAPCFFDVYIFKHRGYDFATWSLLDCGMTETDGKYYVKGDPLRFIHFSGYGTIEYWMNVWLPPGEHAFRTLFREYCEIHSQNNQDKISKTAWSYSVYYSGEKIDDSLRKAYRENFDKLTIDNPFLLSNRQIKSILSHIKEPSIWQKRLKKVKHILRNEGVLALLRVIITKLKNS